MSTAPINVDDENLFQAPAQIPGRSWVSPLNFDPEVTATYDFPKPLVIFDSTLRKILYTAGIRPTVRDLLRVATVQAKDKDLVLWALLVVVECGKGDRASVRRPARRGNALAVPGELTRHTRPDVDEHELTIVAIVLEISLAANEHHLRAVGRDLRLTNRHDAPSVAKVEGARRQRGPN